MNNSQTILSEILCLPSVCYYQTIKNASVIQWELFENFRKQTYRNRFEILSSNGKETVSIPIKFANSKQLTKDVEIDYSENWINTLIKKLKTNYAKSIYYEHYIEDFENIFNEKHSFLHELNAELFKKCNQIIGINVELEHTKSFNMFVDNETTDIRDIHDKKRKQWSCTDNRSYIQTFGNNFVENLSILDLIFCEGPYSMEFIK